jgi:large subunit ribosomal protein L5
MKARLKAKYRDEVVPALMKDLGLTNRMAVPRLCKTVVNMGIGIADKNQFEGFVRQLESITGQKPVVTKAKKSISNFKLREGMNIGAKVTLRGDRMFEFLDRFMNAALPRIRDFRGIAPDCFDGRGNCTIGVKEVEIFPEIDANNAGVGQGLDVTIVTNARDDRSARRLLELMGVPFSKR